MLYARIVFLAAGIYGLIGLLPMYAAESTFATEYPPAITHAEFYYGFLGVTIAWQLAFLMMAWDVRRFRPLVFPALVEKIGFGVPALMIAAQGKLPWPLLAGAIIDLVLAGLFVSAWFSSAPRKPTT